MTITSPFASFNFGANVSAGPATPVATNRPAFGRELATKHAEIVKSMTGPRAEELGKVLMFLDRSYGSSTLLEHAIIHDGTGNPDLRGRVVIVIPQESFFGVNPGFYELRLSWPEINDGIPVVKVSLNYRIESDGSNTLLVPGAGNGDSSGWTNINSAKLSVQELIEAGYIDQLAIPDVMRFVSASLGDPKGILRLTPKSAVSIVLRNTIVPKTTAQTIARNIVVRDGKEAGDDAGLNMAMVHFQGATMLPKISGLLLDDEGKAKLGTKVSINELMARYAGGAAARPAATGMHVEIAPATPASSLNDYI